MIKTRRGVSPVIAVLLLIAIAVATGILVYVWVTGLAGTLQTSGGQQTAEQLQLVAYDWSTDTLKLYLKNPTGLTITVDKVYIIYGTTITEKDITDVNINAGQTGTVSVDTSSLGLTSGASYTVKVVTKSGAVFVFNLRYGQAG